MSQVGEGMTVVGLLCFGPAALSAFSSGMPRTGIGLLACGAALFLLGGAASKETEKLQRKLDDQAAGTRKKTADDLEEERRELLRNARLILEYDLCELSKTHGIKCFLEEWSVYSHDLENFSFSRGYHEFEAPYQAHFSYELVEKTKLLEWYDARGEAWDIEDDPNEDEYGIDWRDKAGWSFADQLAGEILKRMVSSHRAL